MENCLLSTNKVLSSAQKKRREREEVGAWMVCFYSYSVSGRRRGIDTDNIQFNSNPSQGSKEEINSSGHKKYFGYCCYIIPIANIFKVHKTPIFKDIHVLGLVRWPSR